MQACGPAWHHPGSRGASLAGAEICCRLVIVRPLWVLVHSLLSLSPSTLRLGVRSVAVATLNRPFFKDGSHLPVPSTSTRKQATISSDLEISVSFDRYFSFLVIIFKK